MIYLLSLLLMAQPGVAESLASTPDQGVELIADLDGNGKPDRIIRSKEERPVLLPVDSRRTRCQAVPGIFIKYALDRDSNERDVTLLEYYIGTTNSTYWTYRIEKPTDLNEDGLSDLMFYAGDDTTEEYVFLLQKDVGFKAVYTGTLGPDEYALNTAKEIVEGGFENKPRVVARWNPQREAFEGIDVGWVLADCVRLRAEPRSGSLTKRLLFRGEIVRILGEESVVDESGREWRKVRHESEEGYLSVQYLSKTSPVKQFGKTQ